jgi:predicted nucleic acid-binding protein
MNKMKLYLDTSVVSFLEADDAPEKRTITRLFWDNVKNERYSIFLSNLLYAEIGRCSQPKKSILLANLAQINYVLLEETEEVVQLAQKYISKGIIPEKYRDDALHLAHATIAECDAVISWNFRHMVRINTIQGVKEMNLLLGYRQIEIVSPQSFSEGD